jgi:hypothetical protein
MTDELERQDGSSLQDHEAVVELAVARRQAISAIVAEKLDQFAQTRRAAQQGLVRAVETSGTAADVRHALALFAIEASRDYAARAVDFDADIDESAISVASGD